MVGGILAAAALALAGPGARAQERLAQTIGAWTVECHQTEAGGRECQLRNDDDGRPALEQAQLLSFTLHDSGNQAEGLVRVADLELSTRLEVELGLGAEVVSIEGVGRRGRLAFVVLHRVALDLRVPMFSAQRSGRCGSSGTSVLRCPVATV